MSEHNKTINIGSFQAHFRVEGITIYSTEKRHTFTAEEWFEIADQYRSWRERVKPFTTFYEIAQALMQQSYGHQTGPVEVLEVHRSEPVGVYWALVRAKDKEFEIRNWEDWNMLLSKGTIE